jgi:glycosyltransferase involved in cell wall biosynthesis
MGPQPYSVLLAKLSESNLLLHPALEETFGMSIAEAMSLGVPVIGGQASGAVPWVIGEGGVVTDVTSAASIEAAAVALISKPAVHQQYAHAARMRVQENFSAERVAASYESIYLDVLHGAESPREERLTA